MMRVLARLAAVSLLTASLAFAACSEKPRTPQEAEAYVRSELQKAETQGGMGDMFLALRETEPAIYEKLVKAGTRSVIEGRSPFEAGAEVRPAYLARFTELTKTASDENVNALLAFSVKQGEEALKIHPQLCANLAAGAADIRVQQFPKAISDEEVRIMARILRAGQQQEEGASPDEVGVWVTKFSLANPDAMTGLGMIGQPGITDDQARIVCEGNLALMRNLLKEEPALRARLFRGLLALA